MKASLTVALTLLCAPLAVSAATVLSTGVFSGTTENFDTQVIPVDSTVAVQASPLSIFLHGDPVVSDAVMSGTAAFEDEAPSAIFFIVNTWYLGDPLAQVVPHSGTQFATIPGTGYVDITFTQGGVSQFGGYFAGGISTSTIQLFGLDGLTQLGATTIAAGGNLLWAGLTSDTLIGRVRISGNQTAMDDLVFLASAPAPVPLPAAAWLLLSGLAGLGFVARRRTAS